jgi:cation diffusion facilitator family transporter
VKESRFTVYAALAANVAITITKFIAAVVSGSAAMFSEAIHSIVDSGDSGLLLLGLVLSKRHATREHPYGQGLQVYFWTLVVAMSIFGMGGGISIYEGIRHVAAPHPIEAIQLSYGVLGLALVFEGLSWFVSIRNFRRARGRLGVWEGIKRAKDPTTFVVVLEDSAALIGILVAALGLTATRYWGIAIADGAASIVIGVLLIVVAIVLGRETWSLLLGEAATPELVHSIRDLARNQPGIVNAHLPRTMHFGPEAVHVDLELEVDPAMRAGELVETVNQLEEKVRERHPVVHRLQVRFV